MHRATWSASGPLHPWLRLPVSLRSNGKFERETDSELGFGPPPSWIMHTDAISFSAEKTHDLSCTQTTTTPPSTTALQGNKPLLPPYFRVAKASPSPASLSWQNKWTRVSAYAVAFVKEGGEKRKKKTSACHWWLRSLKYNGAALNLVRESLIQKLELTQTRTVQSKQKKNCFGFHVTLHLRPLYIMHF